jgi:hypothetical protein
MGSHRPFGHLKHKLWSKERSGVKLSNEQFDSQPLKVRNWPNFLTCRQRATYRWKALHEGYNFALDLISIKGLHVKLCALKVVGVLVFGIAGLALGSLETKSHLDVAPMERCRVYYKGEGGGFPQVWAMVNLMNLSCPWFVLAPKMFQLCTYHLVLVLCRFVWVIKACQFFLIPSQSSSMPFYPFKVLRAKECAPTPCSSVFFSLDSHLSPSRNWERVYFSLDVITHKMENYTYLLFTYRQIPIKLVI